MYETNVYASHFTIMWGEVFLCERLGPAQGSPLFPRLGARRIHL